MSRKKEIIKISILRLLLYVTLCWMTGVFIIKGLELDNFVGGACWVMMNDALVNVIFLSKDKEVK